jgi:pyrroline-5-carboxylate reductase
MRAMHEALRARCGVLRHRGHARRVCCGHPAYTSAMDLAVNAADLPTTAFIGGGHMASALIGGLRAAGMPAERIVVLDTDADARARLRASFGVGTRKAADAGLANAGIVVWAVKPQSFEAAAAACGGLFVHALQVSVMAGVRCAALTRATGSRRVVRVMPNTPALIGQGIAGLWAPSEVNEDERAQAEALLRATGALRWFEREADLDAVTALSGSGPAYVFYFIEAMQQAAQEMGLSAEAGRALAQATFTGAAELARRSPLEPAALRAQVTSKGGTTQAALEALESAGAKAAFVRALHAARQRAEELGR